VDFRKITLERDRATKEAIQLKTIVDDAKRTRVALQKKLKEEGSQHLAEKRRLEHLEQQSRQRELQTQRNLMKVEEQLAKKEAVWKMQLAAKERESQQLRDLVGKQERARAQKASLAKSTGNSSIVPVHRAAQLEGWISKEVEYQRERSTLESQLQKDIDQRTAIARKLHALRQNQNPNPHPSSTATTTQPQPLTAGEFTAREAVLEHEVEKISGSIAQRQKRLAELAGILLVCVRLFMCICERVRLCFSVQTV
jgi:hypothetical protein